MTNPMRGASTRNLLGPLVRAAYRVRVTGGHLLPRTGGVVVVSNYNGLLDPMLLATNLTRPVAVLVPPGSSPTAWRTAAGRIIVAEAEPGVALREAVELLDRGHAVAAFAEGCGDEASEVNAGAAYLQARTSVPVVPVVLLGSAGARPTDPPRPRSTIDLVVGEPFTPRSVRDPCVRGDVLAVAEQIRQRFADHARQARRRTGGLPGAAETTDRHNGAL